MAVPLAVQYRTRINHCKHHLLPKADAPLGVLKPIEGSPGYAEIRFSADRIILGMPRKSVTNLINEIDLLRQPISEQYISIYNSEKATYYQTFKYQALNHIVEQGQATHPLSPIEA